MRRRALPLPRRLLCYRLSTASLSRAGGEACAVCLWLGGNRGRRANNHNVPATGTDVAFPCPEPGSRAWVSIRYPASSSAGGEGLRTRAAADSALAGARRAVLARVVEDVHRPGDLLCAVVTDVLGPKPIVYALSRAWEFCGPRGGARPCVGAGAIESVDRVSGCAPPSGWMR